MSKWYFAVASFLLAAFGCEGGGSGPGAMTRKGPSPEAFCDALAAAACDGHERCCTDPALKEPACFEQAQSYCMQWTDFLQEEAGPIVLSHTEYRPDLAQAMLDTARESFGACEPFRARLDGVFFAPRLTEGARCLDTDGCPAGTFCFREGEDHGVCRRAPDAVGAPCDILGSSGRCEGGLVCGLDDRCMQPLALGEPCVRGDLCASNVCADNVCAGCIVRRGGGCAGADECSHICPGSLVCEASACVVPVAGTLEPGEACESDRQCSSGLCRDTCQPEGTPASTDAYCEPDVLVGPLWT